MTAAMTAVQEYFRTLKVYVLHPRSGEGESLVGVLLLVLLILPIELGGPLLLAHGPGPWDAATLATAAKVFAVMYLMTYGGLMLNDVCDVEADMRTNSTRPLPRGVIRPGYLVAVSLSFIAAAVALSATINARTAILVAILGALYAVHYGYTKKHLAVPGSPELLTSAQTAFLPVFCFFAMERFEAGPVALAAAFYWATIFSYDIAGGIKDRDGDAANNVRTFAVALGNRAAAILCLATFVLTVAVGVALWQRTTLSWVFLAVLALMGALTIRTHVSLVANADAESGTRSFFGGGKFLLATSGAMILDVLVQRLWAA